MFAVSEPERYSLLFQLGETATDTGTSSAASGASTATTRNAGNAHAPAASPSNKSSSGSSSKSLPAGQLKSGNKVAQLPRPKPVNPIAVTVNQFQLDKLGADRRWSFQLTGLGSVVYLEKSGLKYVVLFDRGLYFEAGPADLGFEVGRILNPVLAAQRCASRAQYDSLGPQQVAGRNAFGFRFAPAAGAAGSASVIITVDQETRLPTRFETRDAAADTSPKLLLEAHQLKLNPSMSLFDVPSGMTKIKTEHAKVQIQSFVAGVQPFIEAMSAGQPLKAQVPAANPKAAAAAGKNAATKSAGSANKRSGTAGPSRSRNGAILSR